jgi:hypothetical protein
MGGSDRFLKRAAQKLPLNWADGTETSAAKLASLESSCPEPSYAPPALGVARSLH